MPRMLPSGEPNRYRIVRLKDKLGTRAMASGEIALEGAAAWLVGELNQGFKQMTEMVNQSRLSNGVRSAGMMRRAVHEALTVALGRQAFGQRLIELPLVRRQLIKMILPAEEALSVALFTADCLDRADAGEAEAQTLRRILTPLIKLRACRDARKVTGDAMEMRGGNGYIEEWIEPRLLRESHLGSIWEGDEQHHRAGRGAGRGQGRRASRAGGAARGDDRRRARRSALLRSGSASAPALALIDRAAAADGDARAARSRPPPASITPLPRRCSCPRRRSSAIPCARTWRALSSRTS